MNLDEILGLLNSSPFNVTHDDILQQWGDVYPRYPQYKAGEYAGGWQIADKPVPMIRGYFH